MNGKNIKIRVMTIVLMLLMISSFISLGNAAEPPSIIILVNHPAEELSIVMLSEEEEIVAYPSQVAWEHYYAFYASQMKGDDEYIFRVTYGNETFDCRFSGTLDQYNEVLLLDLEKRTLSHGLYPFRTVLLVSLRLGLTLLIEGAIFRLFAFREKRSWLVFLLVNLLTQGALNYLLTGGTILTSVYMIFVLIFAEIFVFLTELVTMPLLIKEHRKRRVFAYVLLANTASFLLGGFLIFMLPL